MVAKKPARMLRCRMIRGGIVAVLGRKVCTRQNPIKRAIPRVSRAMMRPSFHWAKGQYWLVSQKGVNVTYGVHRAAPLQRQQQTHGPGDDKAGAEEVELRRFLLGGQFGRISVGYLEQQGDKDHGDAAQGQVDVKAPAPADLGGEGAAQQRADDGRNAEDGAKHALVQGPLVQGDSIDNDDDLSLRQRTSGGNRGGGRVRRR